MDKLIVLLIGQRISADTEYINNPTDITEIILSRLEYKGKWDYPYWNLNRHGMSCTELEDRTIFIGGEHEDYYDPNFHIYNDIIVITGDQYHIYGYPESAFPPTDFHCAIPIGDYIWIFGSMGYPRNRKRISRYVVYIYRV